ncbi:histidine--tRNA ligase [soil metagenome]
MAGVASQVNPPRGMRDFLPAEKERRERVLSSIRSVYRSHGFDEIETPVMEDSERLHAGLGGDNEKLSFGVIKRGLTAEQLAEATDPLDLVDLGLRFDLTVPLARFYATHRAELPAVFRAIQMAPVWRAERPQKGRYRQFVQCDIDIIGEAGPLAEIELMTATADTLTELGLEGWSIRINDRRLLTGMLAGFGIASADHDSALITIDKLDKVGQDGVVAELREKGIPADELERFFRRPITLEHLPFGEAAIRKLSPEGADPAVVANLAAIGAPVVEAYGDVVRFDPFLVRGMGYYSGTIFEVSHPSSPSSLAGGGRYDGMIGRFLGTDVPAAGFSIGFERIVDLVEQGQVDVAASVALVYEPGVSPTLLMQLKRELVAEGRRVRIERAQKNLKPLYEQLAASGFGSVAAVTAATEGVADLALRPLG